MAMNIQKITPCLWFDTQAEEAVDFYVSVFKNSKKKQVSHYSKDAARASGMPEGTAMVVIFELAGQKFMALNGGPKFPFSPAISFVVDCDTQKEVDYFWEKLSEGGREGQCGWLTDRYGVSWQIIPAALGKLVGGPDPERSQRAMKAMLAMNKIDIAVLQEAYHK